jgi:hypothetical protein
MPDSLISKPPACVASLRYCPSSPDQLSAITGIRSRDRTYDQLIKREALAGGNAQRSQKANQQIYRNAAGASGWRSIQGH